MEGAATLPWATLACQTFANAHTFAAVTVTRHERVPQEFISMQRRQGKGSP